MKLSFLTALLATLAMPLFAHDDARAQSSFDQNQPSNTVGTASQNANGSLVPGTPITNGNGQVVNTPMGAPAGTIEPVDQTNGINGGSSSGMSSSVNNGQAGMISDQSVPQQGIATPPQPSNANSPNGSSGLSGGNNSVNTSPYTQASPGASAPLGTAPAINTAPAANTAVSPGFAAPAARH